ncbi:MAG: putative membrane protein [Cyclobacteriaceae bacterium]|jgi:uncharacterized membrane protein
MDGSSLLKKLSLFVQAGFYVAAGANHFLNPEFYFDLIPNYLPWHGAINIVSGVVEIMLGLMLLTSNYRKLAAYGLAILLVAFIPSHIYFITEGSCVDALCVPEWLGWGRLLLVHPLLLLWALSNRH